MGNSLSFKLKKFLQNKNTVTIVGVVIIIAILYFGYNYRINSVLTEYSVPYANVTIQSKTKITEDMISYRKVLPESITSTTILDASQLVGKYVNYNSMVPAGSFFYTDAVVEASAMPDYILTELKDDETLINMSVDIVSTMGNIIYPNNYIDLYVKYTDSDGNLVSGKILQNIKVLAVKDSSGNNVFDNSEEVRTPSMIIFAVSNDIYSLLKRLSYLASDSSINAELYLVPTNESYKEEPGSLKLTSEKFKEFVELYTSDISDIGSGTLEIEASE